MPAQARTYEPLGALHAMEMVSMLQQLGVTVAIWKHHQWRVIHHHPSLIWFEVAHGVDSERDEHHSRTLALVQRSKESQLTEHAGLTDLFMPVVHGGRTRAVLVIGPFMTAPPTADAILERWAWMTGQRGRLTDSGFSRYLTATLATLVLDARGAEALRRSARLLALALGDGVSSSDLAELDGLRSELERPRRAERMWQATDSMVNSWAGHTWSSAYQDLKSLGLLRVPDHALVGLCRSLGTTRDPLYERVQQEMFQRASAKMMDRVGNAIVGKAGARGVIVLSGAPGSMARKRNRSLDLAQRLARKAREFGFQLHIGLGPVGGSIDLSERYQLAMGAAQQAVLRGVGLVEAERERKPTMTSLRQLRSELAAADPADIHSHFELYLEALRSQFGGRLDLLRAHLVAAFERLADTELASGALEDRSLRDLDEALDYTTRDVRNHEELFDAYRRAVSDVAASVQSPTEARRDRTLRRATAFIRNNYAQPLNLRQVAKIAGFAPSHFSVLFKAREHMTFENYLRRCRIERAKQLLVSTELSMEQVAKMSGFAQRHYFSRAFKQVVGVTPGEHRRIGSTTKSSLPP